MSRRDSFDSGYLINTIEDENNVYITFDVPGFDKNNLIVSFLDISLVVKGNRITRQGQRKSIEIEACTPRHTDVSRASAHVRDGLLEVKFPKIKQESKRIEIMIDDE